MPEESQCECAICKYRIEFEADTFLLDEIKNRNAVIFAGAGVSTEKPGASPRPLYAELVRELGVTEENIAFPDLAQRYASQPDGYFRLISKIQSHLDHIWNIADLRSEACSFFYELSTMPYFQTFITTNWDRHIEEICHAKPFVYDADMRFWEVPSRKVLKIHGTIDDYSSIVATREDYNKCSAAMHSSLVGSKLKDILTTKTCIFSGYSLRDDDFNEIFEFVKSAHGKFSKTHYFVSPMESPLAIERNLIPIKTDGTYFLRCIKEHMCNGCCFIPDDVYASAQSELKQVTKDHIELWNKHNAVEAPQILLSASYQDGLIHGYRLALDIKGTGAYSDAHDLQARCKRYEKKIQEYRKRKNYIDAAYFQGFQNSMLGFLFFWMRQVIPGRHASITKKSAKWIKNTLKKCLKSFQKYTKLLSRSVARPSKTSPLTEAFATSTGFGDNDYSKYHINEISVRFFGAGDRDRTDDIQLGKLTFYH